MAKYPSYTLKITEYIKDKHPEVEVIAGGGITKPKMQKLTTTQEQTHKFRSHVLHLKVGKIINESGSNRL